MTTTKSLQLRSTLQHDILPESGKPKRGDSNPSNKSSYAVSPHNSSNKSSCKGCSIEKNIATGLEVVDPKGYRTTTSKGCSVEENIATETMPLGVLDVTESIPP